MADLIEGLAKIYLDEICLLTRQDRLLAGLIEFYMIYARGNHAGGHLIKTLSQGYYVLHALTKYTSK